METFRCPTCIGVLPDARIRRCASCGQNMRHRRPRVLGEETRLGASHLPIDRWMLDRLHARGGRRRSLPPVAWHGRFSTSPLAEPDFAATPSLIATPFAPSTILPEAFPGPVPATAPMPTTPDVRPDVFEADDEIAPAPPVVDALSLDMYTHPGASIAEPLAPPAPMEPMPAPMPVPEPELLAPPPPPVPLAPAPLAPRAPQPMQEELDPEVRALVDELYQQARAELSGDDVAFFTPVADEPFDEQPIGEQPIDEHPVDEPPVNEFGADPLPPAVASVLEPPSRGTQPPAEGPPAPPAAAAPPSPSPEPPAAPHASSATHDDRARGGWVPAFVTEERRQRRRGASD